MKRIILHWSGGTWTVSGLDREHYHYVVSGDGSVAYGDHAPEDNLNTRNGYAAHTRMCNTGSIGVAVAAMHGAQERPFDGGSYPVKPVQINVLVRLVASIAKKYDIPITPETVLMHSEVQQTLGIMQRHKWDLNWIPGMNGPMHSRATGDELRRLIRKAEPFEMDSRPVGQGSPRPVLDRGDEGPEVVELQTLLGILADGDFGPMTEASVMAFQEKHGLKPDGIVGKNTWKKLLA